MSLNMRLVCLGLTAVLGGCLNSTPGSGGGGDNSTGGGTTGGVGMMLCEAELAVTGSFAVGNARPADLEGPCWPDGVWTFTASVTSNNCMHMPDLLPEYKFQVVEDADYND